MKKNLLYHAFALDGDTRHLAMGFTEKGRTWNGWAVPYLQKHEIERYFGEIGLAYRFDGNKLVVLAEGAHEDIIVPEVVHTVRFGRTQAYSFEGYCFVDLNEHPRPKCECHDAGCPVHHGISHCANDAQLTVYRVDYSDDSGTRVCDACGDDCLKSGVFTSIDDSHADW